jgi:hypothetical protein
MKVLKLGQRCACCHRGSCNLYYAYRGGCTAMARAGTLRLRELADDVKTVLSPRSLQGNA